MPLIDSIRRFGTNGKRVVVSSEELLGPVRDGGRLLSDFRRLGGSGESVDRYEITTGAGPTAGSYTVQLKPYSANGQRAFHRAVGPIAVLRQEGGIANPSAPVTCLALKSPATSTQTVQLGPCMAEEGDRLWLVIAWRDQSTLRYQLDLYYEDRDLEASSESLAIAGQGVELYFNRLIAAEFGALSLSAQDATFTISSPEGGALWVRELYDGEYTDGGFYEGYVNTATAVDNSGYYYIGGAYQDEVLQDMRPMLKKYDSNGGIEWVRYYDLQDLIPMPVNQTVTQYDDQCIQAILPKTDGTGLYLVLEIVYFRTYVSGGTFSGFSRYVIVAEVDSAGDIVNQKSLWRVGSSSTSAHSITYYDAALASDNAIVLLMRGPQDTGQSIFLVKLNDDLTLDWEKQVSYGAAFGLGPDDSIYLAEGGALTTGGDGVVVTKLESDGTYAWESAMIPSGGSISSPQCLASKVKVDSQGGVYVCGRINSLTSYYGATRLSFGYLLKLDESGAREWDVVDDPPTLPAGFSGKRSFAYDIRFDDADNVYLASNIQAGSITQIFSGFFSANFFFDVPAVFKYDPDGTLLWSSHVTRDAIDEDTGYQEGFFINPYAQENVLTVSSGGGVLLAVNAERFSYTEPDDCSFNSSVVLHGRTEDFAPVGSYDAYIVAATDASRFAGSTFAASTPNGISVTMPTASTNVTSAALLDLTGIRAYTTALTTISS